jgi:signal transduction histidine kinase
MVKLDLDAHRRALVRVLGLLVGITIVGVGSYGFAVNLRIGGPTALTFLRFAKDMLTALAALASFGLTFRNARASGWLLSAALLVYLGWYYAVMPVLELPSALLPLVIMIIAAYVVGRRALWMFMAAMEVVVLASAAAEWLSADPPMSVPPEFIVAFFRQLFQIALVAVLVDRTVVVLSTAVERSDQQRLKDEQLSTRLGEQMEVTMELQRQVNRSAQTEAAASLATAVSHDLGNLLNVIAAYVERAWGHVHQTEGVLADSLNGIEAAADRAVRLNQRITSLAKATPRHPTSIDLTAVLPEIVPLLAMTLGQAIELRMAVEPGNHRVSFDEPYLALILLNLATNARDAITGPGVVELSCQHVDDCSVVSFSDSGKGIPQAQRQSIFDPFWTTKSPQNGTGLGLFSARQMAESLGGQLLLRESSERGTRFELRLRRADPRQDSSRP